MPTEAGACGYIVSMAEILWQKFSAECKARIPPRTCWDWNFNYSRSLLNASKDQSPTLLAWQAWLHSCQL